MVNRMTLNLKRESAKRSVITWSSRTFEYLHRQPEIGSVCLTSVDVEVASLDEEKEEE